MEDDKGGIGNATDGGGIQDGTYQIRNHHMSKARVVNLQVATT